MTNDSIGTSPVLPKTSERRREANRRNAQLSTGPKTSEGKSRSRFNAVTHGLVAKQLVHALGPEAEGRSEFDLVIAELRASYCPQSVTEELLVERAAVAYWRLKLGARHERQLMEKEFVFHDSAVDRLLRYLAAANREFYQALHELERLIRQRAGDLVPAPIVVDVQLPPNTWLTEERPAGADVTAPPMVSGTMDDDLGNPTPLGQVLTSSDYETKPPQVEPQE